MLKTFSKRAAPRPRARRRPRLLDAGADLELRALEEASAGSRRA